MPPLRISRQPARSAQFRLIGGCESSGAVGHGELRRSDRGGWLDCMRSVRLGRVRAPGAEPVRRLRPSRSPNRSGHQEARATRSLYSGRPPVSSFAGRHAVKRRGLLGGSGGAGAPLSRAGRQGPPSPLRTVHPCGRGVYGPPDGEDEAVSVSTARQCGCPGTPRAARVQSPRPSGRCRAVLRDGRSRARRGGRGRDRS